MLQTSVIGLVSQIKVQLIVFHHSHYQTTIVSNLKPNPVQLHGLQLETQHILMQVDILNGFMLGILTKSTIVIVVILN